MDTSMVVPLNANASPPATREAAHDASPAGSPASGAVSEARGAEHATDHADRREVERLRKRLRELAAELVGAREAARLDLARELHDGVGAELTAARFALANVESALPAEAGERGAAAVAIAQRSLDAACEASRRIVEDLHAPAFEGGIVCALSQWTRTFAERTGLTTSFVCAADVRLTQLPHDAALAVFRVAQEALSNIAMHAGASCADVRIEADARHLTLVVNDNGRGLPRRARERAAAGSAGGGFGLAGMRARCEAFGGTLRMSSREPRGTRAALAAQSECGARTHSGTTVHARFAWSAMLETHDAVAPRRPLQRCGGEVS